jgi:anthranilate synthase/aminodeoxychorismate synthase-like glutamine amidotransferase
MRVLLIDHRDSFTWNVAHGLHLGAQERGLELDLEVRRAADLSLEALLREPPDRLVLGPGPGGPEPGSAGGVELAREAVPLLRGRVPLLGVCLGHQLLAQLLGARVGPGPRPVHGHGQAIEHDGRGLFAGLPRPLRVGRYHSLAVERPSLPPELRCSAWTAEGLVMAVGHRDGGLDGVQFHPDSVLSEAGPALFGNFLAGDTLSPRAAGANPRTAPPDPPVDAAAGPERAVAPAAPSSGARDQNSADAPRRPDDRVARG